MSSETKAREGIDQLVKERDAARLRRDVLEAAVPILERKVRELEDRLYGRPARALNGFFEAVREYEPRYDADHIRIMPKTAHLMLPRLDLFDARHPLDVIDHAIRRIVDLHTEHLTTQLREAVWPRR